MVCFSSHSDFWVVFTNLLTFTLTFTLHSKSNVTDQKSISIVCVATNDVKAWIHLELLCCTQICDAQWSCLNWKFQFDFLGSAIWQLFKFNVIPWVITGTHFDLILSPQDFHWVILPSQWLSLIHQQWHCLQPEVFCQVCGVGSVGQCKLGEMARVSNLSIPVKQQKVSVWSHKQTVVNHWKQIAKDMHWISSFGCEISDESGIAFVS